MKWHCNAPGQGDAQAQFNHGIMPQSGKLLAGGDEEAERRYRLAVKGANQTAMINLGLNKFSPSN